MKPANYAPVYAGLYPELAEIARRHGYAMAVHGSFARDADLVCIPWTDAASEPRAVVDEITTMFVIRTVHDSPKVREHGRIVYSLSIAAPSCFIDLSFTPRTLVPTPPSEAAQEPVDAERIAEVLRETDRVCGWQSCTGCHETNEGAETGDYPYSKAFGCYVGSGCAECGGLGVVWNDYGTMEELADLAAPATGWRTMESAPKDGTQFLISGGTFYYDGSDGPELPFNGVCIAHWDRLKSEWNGGYGSEYNGEYWHTPEGWMPLPPPLHAEGE